MRWSQRKKPSHPVPSAATAKSNRTAGSPNGPKGGRKMPYLTAAWSLAFALASVERAVHHERPRREPRLLEEVLGRPVPRERDGIDPCATARRAERDDGLVHRPDNDPRVVPVDECPVGVVEGLVHRFTRRPERAALHGHELV